MKCFNNKHPWPTKVNYVDKNNKVLGFDVNGQCCESFGHGVFDRIPTNLSRSIEDANISDYVFADEDPKEFNAYSDNSSNDAGGCLAFRLIAEHKPDLYIVIWNYHNGYYRHGWDFNGKEGCL